MEGLSSQRRSSGSFSDDDDQQSNHSAASTTPSTVNNDDVYTALDYAALLNATPASIPLFRGNAVFDIPVPPALLANASSLSSSSPNNDESHLGERTEFSHVRYSALTCKPTGFVRAGYTLRPELYARPRPTGILVSMIVRGEGVDVVRRSLDSVRNAVKLLGSRREKPWGQGAWKKVVLVLACDGEQRPETMALFAAQGLWTDRLLVSRVRGKQVLGHLFEVRLAIFMKLLSRSLLTSGCQVYYSPSREQRPGAASTSNWTIVHPAANIALCIQSGRHGRGSTVDYCGVWRASCPSGLDTREGWRCSISRVSLRCMGGGV